MQKTQGISLLGTVEAVEGSTGLMNLLNLVAAALEARCAAVAFHLRGVSGAVGDERDQVGLVVVAPQGAQARGHRPGDLVRFDPELGEDAELASANRRERAREQILLQI